MLQKYILLISSLITVACSLIYNDEANFQRATGSTEIYYFDTHYYTVTRYSDDLKEGLQKLVAEQARKNKICPNGFLFMSGIDPVKMNSALPRVFGGFFMRWYLGVKIFGFGLWAILLVGCASPRQEFALAKATAEQQHAELFKKIDRGSVFATCVREMIRKVDFLCPRDTSKLGRETDIFRMQGSGYFDKSYYIGDDVKFSCMATQIIGERCAYPPIAPLYIKFGREVVE
jgi:hypothetical protein